MTDEDPAPLIAIPENPAPNGGIAKWLISSDQVRLRAAFWQPDGTAKGSFLILPGRTEFIEKYFELCGELLQRGFAVGILDWRGQGLSDRPLDDSHKGHVGTFSAYLTDLDCLISAAQAHPLPPPYHILAHSMGAHLSLRYLHRQPGIVAQAILCSPMVHIRTQFMIHAVARTISFVGNLFGCAEAYVPGGRVYDPDQDRFEGNLLTGSADRFARTAHLVRADPRLALGSPTFGWMEAAYRSMAQAMRPEFCAAITTPILMLYGSEEKISDPHYQQRVAGQLPNCTGQCLQGASHEILQESDAIRNRFWQAFDAFCGKADQPAG